MTTCTCGSERIAHIHAKHDDRFRLIVPHLHVDHQGYAPRIDNLHQTGGDYTRISFCLDCGRIQDFLSPLDEDILIATE